MMTHLYNAKQFPSVYYARHMFPGLCGYEKETILVDTDAIKRMLKSFIGKPVYAKHQPIDLTNLKEEADGYVVESFYNELDGWAWVKFIAIDDVIHEKIAKGESVSNGYTPTEWGASGQFHNVDYNRKVINGIFGHMAIVPNPRYEEADIFTPDEFNAYQENKRLEMEQLKNSKTPDGEKTMSKLKFWKNDKKEVEIDPTATHTFTNDKGEQVEVSIQEMIDTHVNAKKNEADKKAEDEKENKKPKMNDDDEIDVDGEKMTMKDLVNSYRSSKANAKKNSDEKSEDDKENEAEESESDKKDKENESDETDKKDEEKQNSKSAKHFDELNNAHTTKATVNTIDTSMDKMQRGQSRYGSGK